MPPPLLIDLERVDLSATCITREEIYQSLPHRYEFMLLDGVCRVDLEARQLISYGNLLEDDWWVRGHVPGRPLLPGVLMLEMAGQTCAILAKLLTGDDGFMGFGGVTDCKFREAVVPPAKLLVLCVLSEIRRKRFTCNVQGIVDRKMAFEARIAGHIM